MKINTNDIHKLQELRAFQTVELSGVVYTARDAAHKRIASLLSDGLPCPFALKDSAIYYAGPTPTKPGMSIGSCGPTTSSRMDAYTPMLLDNGLKIMIGKGPRNAVVIDSIIKNKAVYLCAIGGAGALVAKSVLSCEEIAFCELGCESVKKLEIKDMSLIVAIDSLGNSIFKN